MTGLFFLLSLTFALLAYNLYYPNFTHPKISTFSFLAGWLVGELAIHHIALQVILVFLFILGGVVEGFVGALGFVICIGSWLTMAKFYLDGAKAEEEVEAALQEGLGENYRSDIRDNLVAQFSLHPDYDKIRYPKNPITSQVEVIKDLPFGRFNQKLDIYRNRQVEDNENEPGIKRPVLLQIHGGVWTEKLGSKEGQGLPLINHMAQRGWICVSNSYRLSPTATFPEHIVDCKEALVWVKKNIEQYGGDPDFIVVTGGSAGGHLCSLLALSSNDPAYQAGFEAEDTSVQGAVPFYGVYDLTNAGGHMHNRGLLDTLEKSIFKLRLEDHAEVFQKASPLFRVNDKAPPFFIIHGKGDTMVPVELAQEFCGKLKEDSDQSIAYAQISGGQHAFDIFPSVRSEHVKHGVERYLAWLYSAYLKDKEECTPFN